MRSCKFYSKHQQKRQFNRDVDCIQGFFARRYNIHFEDKPKLAADIKPVTDLTKDVNLSGYFKELLGDHAADLQMLDTYYQDEAPKAEGEEGKTSPEDADEEKEEEPEPAKWEIEEDKEGGSENSDGEEENVAEERKVIQATSAGPEDKKVVPSEEKKIVEPVEPAAAAPATVTAKTVEPKEEKKGTEIDLADIKEKVKKQFKNNVKKAKVELFHFMKHKTNPWKNR